MTDPEDSRWLIVFPAPAPLLNMNERLHWTKQRSRARAWRAAARLGVFHTVPRPPIAAPPSTVRVYLPVLGLRRRDPHNYFPTVKHIVDGLVDAGMWPDDTPEYVTTVEPVLRPHVRTRPQPPLPVFVAINPRDDQ